MNCFSSSSFWVIGNTFKSFAVTTFVFPFNHEEETTHESPEALENHINRDLLSFVSLRDEPPGPEHNQTAPGEIDVTEWAISRAAVEWRHTRTQQQATEEQIAKEIAQGSFAEGSRAARAGLHRQDVHSPHRHRLRRRSAHVVRVTYGT